VSMTPSTRIFSNAGPYPYGGTGGMTRNRADGSAPTPSPDPSYGSHHPHMGMLERCRAGAVLPEAAQ